VHAAAPHFSVIVPAWNARSTVAAALEALTRQRTELAYEVLVVDSSDDGTDRLVAERFPAVRLVHKAERTPPGAARNLGVAQSRGRFLAFTDSDCVPPADWLARLAAVHASGSFAAVGGAVRNGRRGNPVSASECLVEFSEYLPSSPAREVEFLPTCNACFRREAFERHGPFDERLYASEDRLLGWRLRNAGERLRFEPTIVVEHLFRTELRRYLRHQRALGGGAALVRRAHALPESWLARHPLRWGVGLARLARLERRFLSQSAGDFLRFNALLPLTASGVLAWGWGFATARRSGEHAPLELSP
jgi:GT2 family glycosyltransferase